MKKILATAACGLLLSGCALPVPLQVASWALDGFSLLTTKKSITDHGISIVAQKDCALWRGVTEGDVCREDDPMALIAQRGDVVDGTDAENRNTSLVTSFIASTSSPVQDTATTEVEAVSWKADSEPAVAPDEMAQTVEAEITVASSPAPETAMADVEEQQAPKWQFVSQEPDTIAPESDNLTTYSAIPGDYFVIGSFGVWDNAKRFAGKHASIEAQILAANVADYRVFRIVVGPYNDANQTALRDHIRKAGVEDIWAVRVPADEITLAWRSSDFATELAAVTSE